MRLSSLVFSFLVTLSLAALVLTYVPGYIGQHRIYVHGASVNTNRDTTKDTTLTVAVDSDPSLQRYYSETEGWTYYTLPAYSSKR
jgi:hypothetical protein